MMFSATLHTYFALMSISIKYSSRQNHLDSKGDSSKAEVYDAWSFISVTPSYIFMEWRFPQISDSTIPTGNNIWSQVPQKCSIPRHTVSRKVTRTSTLTSTSM
jgi:hypothetical protein